MSEKIVEELRQHLRSCTTRAERLQRQQERLENEKQSLEEDRSAIASEKSKLSAQQQELLDHWNQATKADGELHDEVEEALKSGLDVKARKENVAQQIHNMRQRRQTDFAQRKAKIDETLNSFRPRLDRIKCWLDRLSEVARAYDGKHEDHLRSLERNSYASGLVHIISAEQESRRNQEVVQFEVLNRSLAAETERCNALQQEEQVLRQEYDQFVSSIEPIVEEVEEKGRKVALYETQNQNLADQLAQERDAFIAWFDAQNVSLEAKSKIAADVKAHREVLAAKVAEVKARLQQTEAVQKENYENRALVQQTIGQRKAGLKAVESEIEKSEARIASLNGLKLAHHRQLEDQAGKGQQLRAKLRDFGESESLALAKRGVVAKEATALQEKLSCQSAILAKECGKSSEVAAQLQAVRDEIADLRSRKSTAKLEVRGLRKAVKEAKMRRNVASKQAKRRSTEVAELVSRLDIKKANVGEAEAELKRLAEWQAPSPRPVKDQAEVNGLIAEEGRLLAEEKRLKVSLVEIESELWGMRKR